MGNRRILVVEDESVTAMNLESTLLTLGYEVVDSVVSGEEAVRRALELRPDLILMDITLDGPMNGIQAAAEISKSHAIPIIYLTAHNDSETIDRAKITEPFGYLPKPCSKNTIAAAIEMALYKSEADAKRQVIERALQESEESLARTLHAIGDGVIATDTSGRVTRMNPIAEQLSGWQFAEANNTPIDEVLRLVHAETRQPVENPIMQVLAGGKAVMLAADTLLVCQDGREFHIADSAAPIYDACGLINGAVLVFSNVTERYRTEAALRESEFNSIQLIEALPQLVWSCSVDGLCDYLSPQWVEFTGMPAAKQLGSGWLGQVHPDDRSALLTAWNQATANGISFAAEFRLRHHSGAYHWFDTRATTLLNTDGSIAKWFGVNLDITQRKLADQALQASEEQLRGMFNASNDAIFLMQGARIVDCNPKTLEVFGCSREQIIGETPFRFSPPVQVNGRDSKEMALEKIEASLSGAPQVFEWLHSKVDGSPFAAEVSLTRVTLDADVNIMALVRDISERKRAEEEKAKVSEQLRQAQKMESIGTLAGGIAHDFNNILAAIIGFSDLALMRSKENPLVQADIRQVRTAADRATALVRQILTFSRKQQQEKIVLQLATILKEALKLLRASIPSTIEIHQEICSQAMILADPTQVHQLIMNLCANAYQSMLERGGVLRVSLQEITIDQALHRSPRCEPLIDSDSELPPGHYVKLSISDTGCGMDKETMVKIFDPYFTTKGLGQGTGLGLAVVHGIVKDHQGRIAVYSEPGQGTTFNVYLPKIDDEAVVVAVEVAPPRARAQERVMVVDDEKAITDVVKQCLSEAGYRVEIFADGREAWAALAADPKAWELLLSDQTMPGMTGDQLAAKALALRPDLPIIICSGNPIPKEDQSRLSGSVAYLQKPVGWNRLLTEVAKALAG